MSREAIGIAVCVASSALGAVAIHKWGHPASVCLALYPVWLVTAEWVEGRLGLLRRRLPDVHAASKRGLLRLKSPVARFLWWGSIGLGCLGLGLSFD